MPELKELFQEQTLELDGVIYRIKKLSHGEASEVFRGLTKFNPVSGEIDIDADKLGQKRLAAIIADWNITENGTKIPINEETVMKIPDEHAGRILGIARARGEVPPRLEKK